MKRKQIAVALAVLMLITLGWAGARAQQSNSGGASPSAVAVVDLQQVFQNLKQREQIQADLQSKREQLQQTAQKKRKKLAALKGDLDLLQTGTPAYKQKQEQREKAAMELQVWSNFQGRKLRLEERLQSKNLIHKVQQTVGQIAKNNGYDAVLFKDQVLNAPSGSQDQNSHLNIRIVAWNRDGVDLTQQTIQQMNNRYQAGQ